MIHATHLCQMTARLITFLESSCRTLELPQTKQYVNTGTATRRSSNSTRNNVSKLSYFNVATQLPCLLCIGSHRMFKCDNFLKLQAKHSVTHAKQSRLCLSWIQPFTKDDTSSKQLCSLGHKSHRTLLHIVTQNQSINEKISTTNSPPADAKGDQTAKVIRYCSHKCKSRNHLVLATAIVEFRIIVLDMFPADYY